MVLNIVTDEQVVVLERLRHTLGRGVYAPKFIIKSISITSVDILVYSEHPYATISIEDIHQALWPLKDNEINIVI